MSVLKALLSASAMLLATGASAADHAGVITPPDWVKVPSDRDLQGVWPLAAAKMKVNGRAAITCVVTIEGLLADCRVVSETPPGAGFGQAALLLAPRFLMRPPMIDGKPVGGQQVTIPLNFEGPLSVPEPEQTGSRVVQSQNLGIRLVSDPVWTDAPSSAEASAAFPTKAPPDTHIGHVVLQCGLKTDGRLRDCEVSSEQPRGQGFGAAARSLAPRFRVAMETLEAGDLSRTQINLPIHFMRTTDGAARILADPRWIKTIPADKIQEVFPAKAADAGLATGRAVLACAVGIGGGLTGCTVSDEQPAGMDIGAAAIRVAQSMGINPWTAEGLPAQGARVTFAIRLNRKEPEASTPPAAH